MHRCGGIVHGARRGVRYGAVRCGVRGGVRGGACRCGVRPGRARLTLCGSAGGPPSASSVEPPKRIASSQAMLSSTTSHSPDAGTCAGATGEADEYVPSAVRSNLQLVRLGACAPQPP